MAIDRTHYVDNKKLYAAMIEYRNQVLEAKANNVPKPRIPTYIGHCMLMIATRLSLKPNFVNYSYREEMISDGIENCVSYIDNFNPERSNNPFAYFTQIISFAFLRRIQKEKKQLYIKYKTFENSLILNTLTEQGEYDDSDYRSANAEPENDNMSDFIRSFEDTLEKKKQKRKLGIEEFIEENNTDENSDSN